MPTVPTYDLPTVDLAAGNPGLVSGGGSVSPIPDIAGKQMTQMGGALMQTGMTMRKVADQLNYDIADAAAKGFDNQLSEQFRTIINDPEKGYLAQNGKMAVDGREGTIKSLNDTRQKIEDEITDPLQLQMFRAVANKRMQIALGQVDSHALQQAKIYDIGEGKARVNNAIDDAAANYSTWNMKDPDGKATGPFNLFKTTAVQEMNLLADKMGLSKDSAQRKEMVQTGLTKLHTDVISNFIAKDNTPAAAAYLKANKGEIAQDKLDELTKLVDTSNQRDQSLRLSMNLPGTLSEQRAALDKMFLDGKITAEVRDATMTRVEHNWSQKQSQQAVWERGLIGQAQQWLDANKGKTAEDLPAQMITNLRNTGHWATIKSYARSGRYETDPKAWGEVLGMSSASLAEMTQDQFFNKYRSKLDDQDMNKGLAMVASARGDKDPKHTEVRTVQEEIKLVAKNNKIIPWSGTQTEQQQKEFAMFETEISSRIRAWEIENPGKKISSAEVKRIANNIVADKVTLDINWGLDKEVPSYKVQPGDKAYVMISGNKRINLADIPDSDYAAITNDIKQRNKRRLAEGKPLIPITQQIIAAEWDSRNSNK